MLLLVYLETGFAALKNVLVKEGVYSGLCDNDGDADLSRRTGRACTEQDLQVSFCALSRVYKDTI